MNRTLGAGSSLIAALLRAVADAFQVSATRALVFLRHIAHLCRRGSRLIWPGRTERIQSPLTVVAPETGAGADSFSPSAPTPPPTTSPVQPPATPDEAPPQIEETLAPRHVVISETVVETLPEVRHPTPSDTSEHNPVLEATGVFHECSSSVTTTPSSVSSAQRLHNILNTPASGHAPPPSEADHGHGSESSCPHTFISLGRVENAFSSAQAQPLFARVDSRHDSTLPRKAGAGAFVSMTSVNVSRSAIEMRATEVGGSTN